MSLFTLTVKALSRNHIASTSRIDRRNALFLLYSRIPPVRNSSDTAASRPGPKAGTSKARRSGRGRAGFTALASLQRGRAQRCAQGTTPNAAAAHATAPSLPQRRSLTRSTTKKKKAAARTTATPSSAKPLPARPIASRPEKLVARPQSHFLSQSYETILSTSLTVHSLYRPELVQLEDLLRFLVRRAPIQPRCVASHDVGFTGRGTPSPDAPQRVGPPALVRYERL